MVGFVSFRCSLLDKEHLLGQPRDLLGANVLRLGDRGLGRRVDRCHRRRHKQRAVLRPAAHDQERDGRLGLEAKRARCSKARQAALRTECTREPTHLPP